MGIETIPVGEGTIEARIKGAGEPIVLIPGLGVDISVFDDLIPVLSEACYKTIAVNPRGIGQSTNLPKEPTLHDFAADIAGVIEGLGIGPVHVLGAAYGNRVARCVSADFPRLIRSVILISAGGLVDPDPAVLPIFQRVLDGTLGDMERNDQIAAIKAAFFSPATESEAVRFPDKIWYRAIPSQIHAVRTTSIDDWWGGGSAPMLVVQGLDDRIAPPANGRDLKERFGDRVTLIELENAGHALLDERLDAVAKCVLEYLDESRSADLSKG